MPVCRENDATCMVDCMVPECCFSAFYHKSRDEQVIFVFLFALLVAVFM